MDLPSEEGLSGSIQDNFQKSKHKLIGYTEESDERVFICLKGFNPKCCHWCEKKEAV